MRLSELIPLRYKYLFHIRWSHTLIYLTEIGILLFLLLNKMWIPLVLFLTLFVLEDYAHNKKITKIEEAARVSD